MRLLNGLGYMHDVNAGVVQGNKSSPTALCPRRAVPDNNTKDIKEGFYVSEVSGGYFKNVSHDSDPKMSCLNVYRSRETHEWNDWGNQRITSKNKIGNEERLAPQILKSNKQVSFELEQIMQHGT